MGKLNTDFKDDILSEKMNGRKRVKLIPQEDDTYIIEDVTEYTQRGSVYGQKEINLLNSTVNGKLDLEKVIDDLGTALAVTEEGVPVGCKAVSALNSSLVDSLGGMTFGVDADGNYGYIKAGADTVTPFKKDSTFKVVYQGLFDPVSATYISSQNGYVLYRIDTTWPDYVGKYIIIACITTSGSSRQNPGIIYNGMYNGEKFNVNIYDGASVGYPTRVIIYTVSVSEE